jgi:hypothetical protein
VCHMRCVCWWRVGSLLFLRWVRRNTPHLVCLIIRSPTGIRLKCLRQANILLPWDRPWDRPDRVVRRVMEGMAIPPTPNPTVIKDHSHHRMVCHPRGEVRIQVALRAL